MALRLRIPGPVPRRPATRPPLERCNWIVDRLGVGRTLTVGNVARQFEVSPRTAYRDIEFLRDRCQAPLAFAKLALIALTLARPARSAVARPTS